MRNGLYVTRDTATGLYQVRRATARGRVLACVCLPIVADTLGLRPTPADVRSAVREVSPEYPVTDATPVNGEVSRG